MPGFGIIFLLCLVFANGMYGFRDQFTRRREPIVHLSRGAVEIAAVTRAGVNGKGEDDEHQEDNGRVDVPQHARNVWESDALAFSLVCTFAASTENIIYHALPLNLFSESYHFVCIT